MIYAGEYNHMPEFFNRTPPIWLKDSEAPSCLLCNTHFSFVTRKHHCRNCGKIFCVNCCSMKEKLPELGFFDPVRVCRSCARDIANDHYVLKNSKKFLREVIKRADMKLLKWVLSDNNQIHSIFKNLDDSFLDPHDNNDNKTNNTNNGADDNNNTENNDNIPLKPAEIVKLFLDAGAKVDQPIHSGAEKNKTLLFLAAAKGNIEIVKILLKAGATVDKCCDDKTSPLFVACVQGHSNIVKKLLQSKASVNLCRESVSPLYISAFNGNTEIVKILLDAGALVDNHNPLFTTIRNNNTEITKMLLDAGATADNLIANNSTTPLLLATENKNTEIIKLLLNAGATVDKSIPGKNNNTALHLAVKNNCVDIVKVLVMNGADTSIPFLNNGEKKTVWEMSAGNQEMTEALNVTWTPQTHFLLNSNMRTIMAMVLWIAKKQRWVIDRELVYHIISFLLPVKMSNIKTKRASQENK